MLTVRSEIGPSQGVPWRVCHWGVWTFGRPRSCSYGACLTLQMSKLQRSARRCDPKSDPTAPKFRSNVCWNNLCTRPKIDFAFKDSMDKAIKLFIPGPVEVSEKTRKAMTGPMIGHRSADFKALYKSIYPGLQKLFQTQQPVFLSTSSAWGVMEGSIRSLVKKGVLNCMCGAFSDKWFDVSKRCGKVAAPLQVPWGRAINPEEIDRQLRTGKFDALT